MASLDDILLEDETERLADLEFYQNNRDSLKDILLKDIDFVILLRISVILHGTMMGEAEWMAFLNTLGINDNFFITWIQLKAKSSGELPIYLALRGPLQHMRTFGQILDVLIASKRYDVLHDIKLFVEGLLNKNIDSDYILPTAPACDDITDENTEKHYANSVNDKFEKNDLQQSEANKYSYQNSVAQNVCKEYETPKRKLMISVLLLYAEVDEPIARRLSNLLNRAEIIVKMMCDLDYLLLINSTETIHALLASVDFVMPIVSESFLAEIHPNRCVHSQRNTVSWEEDSLANNTQNHYIFQLLLDEYISNRCLNFRVRPVLVPNTNRCLLRNEILLRCSLKLWDAVPKLIEVLKKTKLMLMS